jgi:hypothetical protein
MMYLFATRELTGAGSEITYIPVPCRGIVKGVTVVSDLQMDATGTLTIARASTTVNLVTVPTGNIAAGVVLAGVPDTTNKDLVFDPDSATATYKVIKITDDANFLGGAGTITIMIKYDEHAAIAMAASES